MKLAVIAFLSGLTLSATAAPSAPEKPVALTYRTSFGSCPSRPAGMLSVLIMKEFERNRSLRALKERFLTEKWEEKYFLSRYNVSYNPVARRVRIDIDCPAPLVRVQVYKDDGREHYSAILADNGKLLDPSYEVVMKAERRLKTELPALAIPVKHLESDVHESFTRFATHLAPGMRRKVAEIIINDNAELTMIFSLGGRATSVFLGSDLWEAKVEKLAKIIAYVEKSAKYPSTINLTNPKKVVVRF